MRFVRQPIASDHEWKEVPVPAATILGAIGTLSAMPIKAAARRPNVSAQTAYRRIEATPDSAPGYFYLFPRGGFAGARGNSTPCNSVPVLSGKKRMTERNSCLRRDPLHRPHMLSCCGGRERTDRGRGTRNRCNDDHRPPCSCSTAWKSIFRRSGGRRRRCCAWPGRRRTLRLTSSRPHGAMTLAVSHFITRGGMARIPRMTYPTGNGMCAPRRRLRSIRPTISNNGRKTLDHNEEDYDYGALSEFV